MNPNDPITDIKPFTKPRGPRMARRVQQKKETRELKEQLQQAQEMINKLLEAKVATADQPSVPMYVPKPPPLVARPEGIMFQIEPRNKDVGQGGDPYFAHTRIVPARSDNPNEPDPRICVFCLKNLAVEYQYDISDNPTPEQTIELRRIHQMHMKEAKLMKNSEDAKERRFAADHNENEATKLGRVPDVVAWIGGREWSAEQWNEKNRLEYEAQLNAAQYTKHF